MSYEGYLQILCVKGHKTSIDAYESIEDWSCFTCKQGLAWSNSVDETNGTYCDIDKVRVDGYVHLTIDIPPKMKQCATCKHIEILAERTYKIPDTLFECECGGITAVHEDTVNCGECKKSLNIRQK